MKLKHPAENKNELPDILNNWYQKVNVIIFIFDGNVHTSEHNSIMVLCVEGGAIEATS